MSECVKYVRLLLVGGWLAGWLTDAESVGRMCPRVEGNDIQVSHFVTITQIRHTLSNRVIIFILLSVF